MKSTIILSFLFILLGCNSEQPSSTRTETKEVIDTIKQVEFQIEKQANIDTIEITGPTKPIKDLISFKVVGCENQSMQDSGSVIQNNINSNILTVKVKHWINCSYKYAFLESCQLNNHTLNIQIDIPHKEFVEGEFIISEYSDKNDCNCLSEINVLLKGYSKVPKEILVNSQPVKNGYWNPAR